MPNKTAVVTGASSNIGQGIAIVLAEHGYDIAFTYNGGKEGAQETREAIEKLGRRCFVYQASLQNAEVPAQVLKRAHEDLGHIDVMVCNAGQDRRHSILTITPEEIDHLWQTNYRNYMLCTGAAARHMVRDGIAGSIIFITSSRAERAYPNDFLYGGIKAAMKRSCESLALELSQYNIRCNCVAPGATWKITPSRPSVNDVPFVKHSIPMHRSGTAREMGEACAYLSSEHASYITGVSLRLDGGLILPGMMEGNEHIPWVQDEWIEANKQAIMERDD